jgi:hypothetical protein
MGRFSTLIQRGVCKLRQLTTWTSIALRLEQERESDEGKEGGKKRGAKEIGEGRSRCAVEAASVGTPGVIKFNSSRQDQVPTAVNNCTRLGFRQTPRV